MAINLICPECRNNLSVGSKICKKCGHVFNSQKKYRVIVKVQSGKRISKVLDNISMAKKLESKLKTQILEGSLFGIKTVPTIDEIWPKYLEWAKQSKKSWNKDLQRWQMHVQPYLNDQRMDTVTAFDVQKVIDNMKAKKDYAPATIKHVVVLIKRVYNWAIEMELYDGGIGFRTVQPVHIHHGL